jgi:hypothetical protein
VKGPIRAPAPGLRAGSRVRLIEAQTHSRKENIMRFMTWLRSENRSDPADRRRRHGPSRGRAAVRPRLEMLEERRVLSTLTVTNNLDGTFDGSTLRNEIAAAQPGDTIVFASGLQTISLGGSELEINKNLTIQGPGASLLAVSGDLESRVFRVDAGVSVTIKGLTIEGGGGASADTITLWTGGNFPDYYDGHGGGILNLGTLALGGCTVTGNMTRLSLGGASSRFEGGGIFNGGALTLSGCTVTGNTAPDYTSSGTVVQGAGGGIFNDTQGHLTILSSDVLSNTASIGPDICNLGSIKISKDSTIGSKVANKLW